MEYVKMGDKMSDICNSNKELDQIVENVDVDNEKNTGDECQDKIINKIIELSKERHILVSKNQALQQKLSMFIAESSEKEYFLKLNFTEDADEWTFRKLLDDINDKVEETEVSSNQHLAEIESLKEDIKKKEQTLIELNALFKEATEKAALNSINSETGKQFTVKEVKELLLKEEELSKTLQEYQLHAIQKRYNLNTDTEKKTNLAEGPLDFAEYEMMCIETQNNKELIQPISEEIKSIKARASNVINTLSHLKQKLYLAQEEKIRALSTEKLLEEELNKMRDLLFSEKLKYNQMKHENKELQHKFILLQHPGLIEDYNTIMLENEEAQKKLQQLKDYYEKQK